MLPELNGKRLELLMDALANARRIAVLSDPRITTPSISPSCAMRRDRVPLSWMFMKPRCRKRSRRLSRRLQGRARKR